MISLVLVRITFPLYKNIFLIIISSLNNCFYLFEDARKFLLYFIKKKIKLYPLLLFSIRGQAEAEKLADCRRF